MIDELTVVIANSRVYIDDVAQDSAHLLQLYVLYFSAISLIDSSSKSLYLVWSQGLLL
jgi:hypothetical protein